jgi:HK97 family phage major capsid protein
LVGVSKKPLVDLLRPFSAIANFGPTVLEGLTSDLSLPAVSVGFVTGWTAEGSTFTSTDPVFSLPVALTPETLSVVCKVSRKLMASTGFDFQAGLMREIYAAIGQELDRVALLGDGTGNAPLGILAAPGTTAITFDAAATWAKCLSFVEALGKANAPKDKIAWLGSNNAKAKLQAAPRSSGNPNFCWQDGKIADYRAEATSHLDGTDQLILGSWDNLVIGIWLDGIQVTVDPFTSASTNEVRSFTPRQLARILWDFAYRDVCTQAPQEDTEIPSEVAMIIDNDNREITEIIRRHKAKSLH